MHIFIELSALMVLTTLVTLLVRALKQPLVLGYIISGILAGPYVLNVLQSTQELEFFAKVGIVFLLFIVGLHLNPMVIKEVGSVSLLSGIGQVVLTSFLGFVIAIMLGIDRIAALYVAIALTLSSTIVVLKLLADKNDLQKLYAKISIGLLLVQDIVATFIFIGISMVSGDPTESLALTVTTTLLKGLVLFMALHGFTYFILPRLLAFVASSQELLFLFSLAWGLGIASVFSLVGFSIEIGALIAGVTLAMTPYAEEAASRLKPLRDFFIVIFFILLGAQTTWNNIGSLVLPTLILSLFVLIGNPVIVIIIMNLLGYSRRTGFLAGLTMAQMSEFSLILASLGMHLGHVPAQVLSLITLTGLVTIAGSTYLIIYSERLYPKVTRLLAALELIKKRKSDKGAVGDVFSNVIFGYDRVGDIFADALKGLQEPFLVVDFNPASLTRLETARLPYRFGDAGDVEFLEDLPVPKPRLVISTIPEVKVNRLITRTMLLKNPNVLVITIAQTIEEAHSLYAAGAAYVVMPHWLGAAYAAQMITEFGFKHEAYLQAKNKQLQSAVFTR